MDAPSVMEVRASDTAVLSHVSLYRLTFKEVIARLFVPEGPAKAGTTLAALERREFLVSGAFPGPLRYYTLSPKGAALVAAPKERAEPPGAAALAAHLAAIWFCCLGEERRHRLEPEELRAVFGDDTPFHNVAHAVADEADGHCVYRLYSASGLSENVVKAVSQHVRRARLKPKLRDALETGAYRFAVLAETPEKCAHIRRLLERAEDPALTESGAHIVVRFAPSPRTLPDALKRLRESLVP